MRRPFLRQGAGHCAGYRVDEPQQMPRPCRYNQVQRGAVPPHFVVVVLGHRQRTVFAVHQSVAGQRLAVQVAAGGVVTPVFGDANLGVQRSLARNVAAGGAGRGDFQHEVGRLAHQPHKIAVQIDNRLGVHVEGYVAIRRYLVVQVVGIVIDEGLAADGHPCRVIASGVRAGAWREDVAQHRGSVHDVEELKHGVLNGLRFGERGKVGVGILPAGQSGGHAVLAMLAAAVRLVGCP